MIDFDLIIAANMAGGADDGLRIALEARAAAASGRRVGLVNLAPSSATAIHPDIQACVTRGLAHPIAPDDGVATDRITLHSHGTAARSLAAYRVTGNRIDVVFDERLAANPLPMHRWLSRRAANIVWAARNARLEAEIAPHLSEIEVAVEKWALPLPDTQQEPGVIGRKLAIGHIRTDPTAWPRTIDALTAIFPADGSFDVLFLGPPPDRLLRFPHRWKVFEAGDVSLHRFLERLDALVILDTQPARLPEAAIAWMHSRHRPVFVPPTLDAGLVPQAIRATLTDVPGILRSNVADRVRLSDQTRRKAHRRHLAPSKPKGGAGQKRPPPQAIFLASNGIGLGHVTRLLAIARRCSDVHPVFVTMSPVSALVESYGYSAHYIPSHRYVSADLTDWDAWFQAELEMLIDLTNAALVVYDGNALTTGLVKAAGSRGAELVWVRGGMLGTTSMPTITNDRYCDAVIEPGELAEDLDLGVTKGRRDGVQVVSPVLLLDSNELLTRDEARDELGLDRERPAVLIQLGSTTNRDTVAVIDQIVAALRKHPSVQIVVADWFVGDPLEPRWDGVLLMRGHPFSRYFNAFDFSFAAAGYNTFHEVISASLPTIFIANRHRSMDDQDGRSRFAEAEGIGLHLGPDNMDLLDEMVAVLMNDNARDHVRSNCRRRRIGNGASAAAKLISQLAVRDRLWTWPSLP